MAEFLWIFWSFSLLGWGLERLFAAVTRSPQRRRRCLLLLPLCPVYGLGMAAVLALPLSLIYLLLIGFSLPCLLANFFVRTVLRRYGGGEPS